jgi:hypothetical protein
MKKTIVGKFFAAEYDGMNLVNGMNVFSNEPEELKINYNIIGYHPKNGVLPQYEGSAYKLDLYRIKTENNRYFYYGKVEVTMCYYFFYEFSEEDIEIIKREAKVRYNPIPNYPNMPIIHIEEKKDKSNLTNFIRKGNMRLDLKTNEIELLLSLYKQSNRKPNFACYIEFSGDIGLEIDYITELAVKFVAENEKHNNKKNNETLTKLETLQNKILQKYHDFLFGK